MTNRKLIAGMSLLLVFVLAVAFVAPGTVAAKSPDKSQEGGNNKILVTNLPAGSSVTVAPFGGTSGTISSETGGSIETYAHVGTPTALYLNDPTRGSIFLGVVQANAAWPDTIINAQAPQSAFTLPSFGVASPMVNNQGTSMNQPGTQSQQGMQNQPAIQGQQGTQSQQGMNMGQQLNPTQSSTPGQQPTQSQAAANSPWGAGFISRGLATAAQFSQDYVVKSGDTLGAIARQFGTTVADLASVNNLSSPYLLKIGESLKVPASPLTGSSSSMSNQGTTPQQNPSTSSSGQGVTPQQNPSSGNPSQNSNNPTNQGGSSSGSGTGY